MKSIDELQQEHGEDQDGLRDAMMAALATGHKRIPPQIAQQAQLNWQMMLLEYVLRQSLADQDDELIDEAVAGFRLFAQHSHLVNMYNALFSVSQKKLTVVKA